MGNEIGNYAVEYIFEIGFVFLNVGIVFSALNIWPVKVAQGSQTFYVF